MDVNLAAEYLVTIALQDSITGVINCGSGCGITVEHFVKQYLDKHKLRMELNLGYYPYTDYEPMRFWSNNSRLNQILENE